MDNDQDKGCLMVYLYFSRPQGLLLCIFSPSGINKRLLVILEYQAELVTDAHSFDISAGLDAVTCGIH